VLETVEDGGEDVRADEDFLVDEVEGEEAGSDGGSLSEKTVEFVADEEAMEAGRGFEDGDGVGGGEVGAAPDLGLEVEALEFAGAGQVEQGRATLQMWGKASRPHRPQPRPMQHRVPRQTRQPSAPRRPHRR